MIRLVLTEDHTVVREGFRAILEAEADFSIVGETGDGLEAVQLARAQAPDVLIVDLMMPGLSGLEVIRQVRRHAPETGIVVLSMHDDEAYVLEALQSGASAYVLKRSGAAELKKAVREVAQGRRYLGPPLSERAIEIYLRALQEEAVPADPYGFLTNREREVLHLTVAGHTSTVIGRQLSISPRTVEKHRSNLMQKLGVHNKAELVQYALSRGLIAPKSTRSQGE